MASYLPPRYSKVMSEEDIELQGIDPQLDQQLQVEDTARSAQQLLAETTVRSRASSTNPPVQNPRWDWDPVVCMKSTKGFYKDFATVFLYTFAGVVLLTLYIYGVIRLAQNKSDS